MIYLILTDGKSSSELIKKEVNNFDLRVDHNKIKTFLTQTRNSHKIILKMQPV